MASNSPLDKLSPTQRLALAVAILVIGAIVTQVRGCKQSGPAPAPGEPGQTLANRNVRFGLPAEAKHDPESRDAYLIDRPQYVLSYNDSKKIPNWVCWNLSKGDIGNTPRSPFTEDPDLPGGFRRVTTGMYTGGGFDRGHICPSKDRSDTEENNRVLFFMTNIVPQAPAFNRGNWERLEAYCRDLVHKGSELYIAAGPHGQGGAGTEGKKDFIGHGQTKIEVPAALWKVILVLPGRDAVPDAQARTIAVWIPNDQSATDDWKRYAVTVADVEQRTGFKFFPLVPADVATALKGRADAGP